MTLSSVCIYSDCRARTNGIEVKTTGNKQKKTKTHTMETLNWRISTKSLNENGMHGSRVTNKVVIIIAKDFFCSGKRWRLWCGTQSKRAKAYDECVHKYARHETNSGRTRTPTSVLGDVCECVSETCDQFSLRKILVKLCLARMRSVLELDGGASHRKADRKKSVRRDCVLVFALPW